MKQTTGGIFLYGFNPFKEFFLRATREGDKGVSASVSLFVTKEARERDQFMSITQKHKIAFEVVTREEIESMAGKGVVHQGIAMRVSEKMLYSAFDETMSIESKKERSLVVLLDELEDPHNVGAIIRSAASFGGAVVLLPMHGQTNITGTVVKTASGLNFALSVCQIGNINTTIEKLKKLGYWIYGLEGEGESSLLTTEYDNHSVLVIGAEGKGIREKTLELCDFKVSIPIEAHTESLNASVAASIALYEWKRQSKS
jgi:23S rRNA (guanosine2251-2'-O)-methyltransferase